MREATNEWTTFLGKLEIALHLEDKLGIVIPDAYLEGSETVQELAILVSKRGSKVITVEAVLAEAKTGLSEILGHGVADQTLGCSFQDLFAKYSIPSVR